MSCGMPQTPPRPDHPVSVPPEFGIETTMAQKPVRIGCSGWSYADWRDGVFYPPKLPSREFIRHYATQFETVELNSSFYRLPVRSTVERWASQVPDGFRFAVKVSRYLTHVVRLDDTAEHLGLLLERIEPLVAARKLGPLLWQLPPTLRRDDERLAAALAAMPTDLRHAIEFRDPSWFTDEVMSLLERHQVALVIGDRPELHAFQTATLTTDFTYIRFHYGSRGRRGNYSNAELDAWARRIDDLRTRAEVWVYFNNDWEAFAPANAHRLRALLAGRRRTSSASS